jgi:hypothetical protein
MQQTRPHRRVLLVFLAVCLVAFAFVAGFLLRSRQGHAPAGVSLTDLRDIDDLKARFNADAGQTRLVVIFSPT